MIQGVNRCRDTFLLRTRRRVACSGIEGYKQPLQEGLVFHNIGFLVGDFAVRIILYYRDWVDRPEVDDMYKDGILGQRNKRKRKGSRL